jgi:23S rRNA pseudouridine1911/1915/1917 synthase
LLNRLDNDTGGLVLFAKNDAAFVYYSGEMKNNRITKEYIACVDGIPVKSQKETMEINLPIAHHPKDKKKMIVVKNGKQRGLPREAITKYRILKTGGKHSFLKVFITKGRRHQIRVHLAEIGLPIVGDKLYNKDVDKTYQHHLLYATGVNFTPYGEDKEISVKTECPFYKIV